MAGVVITTTAPSPSDEGPVLKYEPLDPSRSEIRLVTVAQTADGRLDCSLSTYSLDDNPAYYALSYAWGDLNRTTPITVDGQRFKATDNLVQALCHLSGTTLANFALYCDIITGGGLNAHTLSVIHLVATQGLPPLLLWIDALCIHQDDTTEKNCQMGLMNRIYSQAQTTLVWLGAASATSSAAMALVRKMSADYSSHRPNGSRLLTWLANPIYETLLEVLSQQDMLWAICDLFERRPYWSRVWPLQEMILAKRALAICGTDACPLGEATICLGLWPIFRPLSERPPGVSDRVWNFVSQLVSHRTVSRPLSTLATLRPTTGDNHALNLLGMTRWLQATDPRDKLYGLSNLTDLGITVDYALSYPVICRNFAAAQIMQRPNIGLVLEHVRARVSREAPWPSWVPDWDYMSKLPRASHGGLGLSQESRVLRADTANRGFLLDSPLVEVSGDTLIAAGVQLDVISEVLHPSSDSNDEPFFSAVEFFFGASLYTILTSLVPDQPSKNLYTTGIPLSLAVLRILVVDHDFTVPLGNVAQPINTTSASFERLAAVVLCYLALPHLLMDPDDPSFPAYLSSPPSPGPRTPLLTAADIFSPDRTFRCSYAEILRIPAVSRVMEHIERGDIQLFESRTPFTANVRPFRTREGYLGYAGPEVCEGDVICVLGSCAVPVVLRKVAGRWVFVSLCFVLGFMEGRRGEGGEGEGVVERFEIW
ncbi:hypothetical protein N0V88_002720 [Collariella sp. IMI 366227]|nr:hypothetical protein N0V88_002720 [Collariella sp. IMI 366227]